MIIQHNIMAINSHRQLGVNNTNLGKNLEKLSSGYRINKAADDAAGLAISERMRAQIRGLERAMLNAQDGASLIQTAEGALTEVHSMLNRMVELATQSANGTIQGTDREKVEAETKALKEEIDRISQATNFNGINLLDGSLSATAPQDIAIEGVMVTETPATAGKYGFSALASYTNLKAGDKVTVTLALDNRDSYVVELYVSDDGQSLTSEDGKDVYLLSSSNSAVTASVSSTQLARAVKDQLANGKLADQFIIQDANGVLTFTSRIAGTAPPQVTGLTQKTNDTLDKEVLLNTAAAASTVPSDAVSEIKIADFLTYLYTNNKGNEDTATFSVNGSNFVLVAASQFDAQVATLKNKDVNIIKIAATTAGGAAVAADMQEIAKIINQKTGLAFEATTTGLKVAAPQIGNGLTMQVGDTAADFNKITVSVDDMSAAGLGITSITMTTQESARRALDRINSAIETVSVNRGNLGALQNRLEHTLNNLGVTTENMTAAESRIRDVDMAKEMMAFTKNNVLAQAAQAMLAQANMQPQNVLQLLR